MAKLWSAMAEDSVSFLQSISKCAERSGGLQMVINGESVEAYANLSPDQYVPIISCHGIHACPPGVRSEIQFVRIPPFEELTWTNLSLRLKPYIQD